jgi:stage III sporulation protein AE
MRKVKTAAAAIIVFTILAPRLAAAETSTYISESNYSVSYKAEDFGADSIFDAIPEDVRNNLPDGAENLNPKDVVDKFSLSYFTKLIGKLLTAALYPAVKMLSTLLGLVIISSALGALKGMFKSESMTSVFDFVSGLCIMLAMFSTVSNLFESVKVYLNRLSGLINVMLPVMTAMNIAGGNLSASVVSANAMMISLAFIETLATKVLFPVLQICFGMTIASCMGSGLKLDGISKLVRGVFTWILGLISAGISAMMSFQNTIAERADSLSMRAVKFAATSAIPVAGNIAGDAVRTVAGSLTLVRSTVGWVGIILILLLTMPVIIEVLLTRLGVTVSSTAAGIIGLEREKTLLSELSGLLGFLIAVCVISSLMFIYALALFARCSAAAGA